MPAPAPGRRGAPTPATRTWVAWLAGAALLGVALALLVSPPARRAARPGTGTPAERGAALAQPSDPAPSPPASGSREPPPPAPPAAAAPAHRADRLDDVVAVFRDRVAGPRTVAAFKRLQALFDDAGDLDAHLRQVREALRARLGQPRSDEVADLYERFTRYELDLERAARGWAAAPPGDPAEALRVLGEAQRHREAVFGRGVADALWGDETRALELQLRRSAVLADAAASGDEKERRLAALGAPPAGPDPSAAYQRFQDRLRAHAAELARMSPEAQAAARLRWARELLPPDAAARLEEVEARRRLDREAAGTP